MPETAKMDVEAELKKLQDGYLHKLPSLSKEVQASWQCYRQAPCKTALDTLCRQVHAISGTSAVLSITGVSKLTQQLEEMLGQRHHADALSPSEYGKIAAQLECFFTMIEQEDIQVGNIF